MAKDKTLETLAAVIDSISAMQRGDDEGVKEKLSQAKRSILEAADQRATERLVNLF